VHTFWSDTRGQIAIVFTIALPALIAAMGMAVDYTAWTGQTRQLQAIADIAATAGAKELHLANSDAGQVKSVAKSIADAQLLLGKSNTSPLTVSTRVINDGQSVEVTISQARNVYFAHMVMNDLGPLSATATARLAGGGRLCVIALDESASGAVDMRQSAQMTATRCSVYSNSTSASGMDVSQSASIEAELICSAGGADGGSSNYDPSPTTDCPQLDDPLASRPAPDYGSCDHDDLVVKNKSGATNLYPGVYCGGIQIQHGDVHFTPGVYVIKDGSFSITANSMVTGENVGFYLTGDDAVFDFGSNSDIDFTAPKEGPLAGILFFEDRNAPTLRRHVIKSKKADNLLGTVYLPRGIFVVETNNKVADQSAYTAVIANRVELSKKPNLYLNANYDSTDVPVPNGVGPVGGNIYLEK